MENNNYKERIMDRIKKIAARAGQFVEENKVTLAVVATAITCGVMHSKVIKTHNEFLKEHDLFEKFYDFNEE